MTGKTSQTPVSNLPQDVTSFVGRRRELTDTKRLLSGTRLLTLIGPGGVGKTRMAIRVACEVRRAFPSGVWLVELADLRSASLLPHTVAAAIGIRDTRTDWSTQTLASYLSGKRMLLVLDNCEHLVEDCAALVYGLLAGAADLQILATSRESLKAPGEQVLTVPPLTVPAEELDASVGDLLHYDAVELFVARAAARAPGFVVDDGNRNDVAQLCQRLDGMPLAIELAADRIRAMTPRQINERLTSRLALLTAGARGVPTRQQTLRASIDWSYDLCSEAEKTLWAWLSVFIGGFDLDAVEGLCTGTDISVVEVADLVASLLDKSILVREDRGSVVRYRMLEALREYGDDRLRERGDREPVMRRHRDWYANIVFDAYDEWVGPRQVELLSRLQLEHSNIRSALEFSLAEPDGYRTALPIGRSLMDYWLARGLVSEGRHWLHSALSRSAGACAERAEALCLSAFLAGSQDDYAAASGLLDEAQEVLSSIDDPAALAFFRFVSGTLAIFANEFERAAVLLEDALAGFRACGNLVDEIRTLFMFGITGALGADHDRGASALEECLRITEKRSESWFRSYALLGLGIEYWSQSNSADATAVLRQSLRLKAALEDQLGRAWCYETLAWVAANDKDDKRAATLLGIADTGWSLAGTMVQTLTVMQDKHNACEAKLRNRLSEAVVTSCRRQGASLSPDGALAYAIGDEEATAAPGGEPDYAPLTRREWQIAEAVAQGLTNRQIANKHVIAQRTAEGHVEHILTKLGFHSRAQIASWVTEQRAGTHRAPAR
jgi:predicted ATPase/DNA-binding CsgD family transcriptional regulator